MPADSPPGGLLAAVFVGGCLGGGARYAAEARWPTAAGGFPLSILVVNVVGCFLLALLVVVIDRRPEPWLRPLLGTGACGALTTFSFVAVAVVQLAAADRWALAGGYLLATATGGLLAAVAGRSAGRLVVRAP